MAFSDILEFPAVLVNLIQAHIATVIS